MKKLFFCIVFMFSHFGLRIRQAEVFMPARPRYHMQEEDFLKDELGQINQRIIELIPDFKDQGFELKNGNIEKEFKNDEMYSMKEILNLEINDNNCEIEMSLEGDNLNSNWFLDSQKFMEQFNDCNSSYGSRTKQSEIRYPDEDTELNHTFLFYRSLLNIENIPLSLYKHFCEKIVRNAL